MATNLLELTADIVITHASTTEMSSNELLKEIKQVYETLEGLVQGKTLTSKAVTRPKKETEQLTVEEKPVIPQAPVMTIEEAFKPDQVACMICGKKGMTTLKRHLSSVHDLKPGKYRKQFNIPKNQPLAATEYIEKRRQMALDRGLGEKLAKAREMRKKK
jgi:predicted transcriptional regulator